MAAKDVIIEPKSYREKIKCPGCGLVQTAMVLLTKPFHTKQHTCIQCGTEIDAYGTNEKALWDVVYTTATEEVVCPYCGAEVGDYVSMSDRNDETVECDECDKDFKLEVQTFVEFASLADCELNGQQHQWEVNQNITTPDVTWHYCVRCDATIFTTG